MENILLAKDLLRDKYEFSGFEIVHSAWKEIIQSSNNYNENTFFTDERDFVTKFYKGFMNRPSMRLSNAMNTFSDLVIDDLISERIPQLTEKDIKVIRYGHKLSMAAENLIGAILEEYIHDTIWRKGWACCWGSTIKAVDFCSKDGKLLQVKNKSNTENSSSNKIREGTTIQKWYRLNAYNGKTKWDDLNNYLGHDFALSEDRFRIFARNVVKTNPNLFCLSDADIKHYLLSE